MQNVMPYHSVRRALYWLLISQCVTFRIALMMFDCSCSRCLKYFGDVYTCVYTIAACLQLRSVEHGDLIIPHVRSTHFGRCNFHVRSDSPEWHPTGTTRQTLGNSL